VKRWKIESYLTPFVPSADNLAKCLSNLRKEGQFTAKIASQKDVKEDSADKSKVVLGKENKVTRKIKFFDFLLYFLISSKF